MLEKQSCRPLHAKANLTFVNATCARGKHSLSAGHTICQFPNSISFFPPTLISGCIAERSVPFRMCRIVMDLGREPLSKANMPGWTLLLYTFDVYRLLLVCWYSRGRRKESQCISLDKFLGQFPYGTASFPATLIRAG